MKSTAIVAAIIIASTISFSVQADTVVSFTATLPDGTTSARLHSDALGWDVNHADGVATDNGDGTWTATIPAPWAANANYKWLADGVEENLKDDVDAGYCANDGLNSGDWGANRVYSGSGDVTGQVYGECSDTPAAADDTTGVVSNLVFDFEDNTVQYPSYGGVAASYATQDDAGVTRNMLKLVNGAGADWWSGVTIAVMPAGNDFLGDGTAPATMRVYAEQDGNLNLELEADGQGPAVVNLAVTQGWNDLSFDFSGADAAINWHKIQIRPDAAGQAANGAETTYYIDDLSFPNASILDSDSDGVNDLVDDLPNDATETVDSDGDGVGDNADELPNDPAFSTQAEYDAAQAIPASPVPTAAADSVLSIFSNAYTDLAGTDFNPGWGQATQVTVADDVITYTGLNYQGTAFTNSDVSGYGYINVDFYTADSTVLKFTIISPGQEKLLELQNPIVTNQWNSVQIPLTEFDNVNLADVFQFKFDGNGTVLVDNLYFGGAAPAPADSDGDGVPDSEDYAPNDPNVQNAPTTTYCSKEVTHFNVADHGGSIRVSVNNLDADSIKVEASSNVDGRVIDLLQVGTPAGATVSDTVITDGIASAIVSWSAGTMPATTSFSVMWSDDVEPGNQMLNAGTGADALGDIDTANTCSDAHSIADADTTVSFTVSGLPDGTTSARLHSEALGWDTNHADGVATDNGDGTWTATIPAPWTENANYKWLADGVEENLKDDVDAGYCANDGLNSGDWGANRLYSGSGDVTGQVYGECSDTPAAADDTTGVVSNLVFDFEDNTVQYPSYGGVAASYATQDDAGVTRNMLKLVNGAGADWWSGVTIAVMPAGNDFLGDGTAPATMRVYAEQDGNLNLELEADGQGPAVVNLAVAQGWNDLSFDFSGADAAINWHKIQIRPDAAGQAANGAETTYYIDDLSFPGASILDSDSDGVNDLVDDLPNDATETVDSDGDGVGDNADELPYDPAFSTQAEYDAAQAMPAAPTPTDAVDSVLSIFSNAYTDLADTNFNPGWGQATQVAVDDVITYTGLNYQGTEFTSSDVSGYGHINIDFYTTNATDLQFTIISPGKENLISLTDKIVLNQWVSVEIPLTDFIADLTSIFQFKVVGNGTVVLDNLYFGGVGEVVEPPAQVNVTFQVNMAGVDTTNGVSVMGGAVFGQAGLDMSDADGDNIWTVTTQIAHNTTVAFKYRNTTELTWNGQESVTGDCTFGEWSDRQVDVVEADITLDVVSFGNCTNLIATPIPTMVFDFEDNTVQYPSYGGVAASYATQDDAGVTRNMLKLVNGAGADWWSGVTIAALPTGNDFRGDGTATMRVYAEQDGNLNLELEADGQGPAVVNLAVTQGWNDLSFDFSGADAAINWHKIQIRPDAAGQAANTAETTYYIDDISFPNASILDSDDDGANDLVDDLPNDATETVDSDGDGVGDNADELPNDPAFSTQAAYDAAHAIPASPVPTEAADSVLSIFSNDYTDVAGTDFNPNWGQATQVVVADDVLTYTGLNYQGTQFASQDVSGYEYIHLDFYTTDATDLKFTIISPGQERLITLANQIVLGQWVSVDINLGEYYNVDLTAVNQFKVVGNGTVVLDNLYFGGTAPLSPWDFDGNGKVDALTDGLLMLRYAFELRDDRLVNDQVVATDSTLSTSEIQARIEDVLAVADIDGNGSVDPLSDGLLLLRYMFDVTGESLVDGVVDLDCGTRTTHEDVEYHIENVHGNYLVNPQWFEPELSGCALELVLFGADDASEVRITGPWWNWDPNGGPVAYYGIDAWIVEFDPAPDANMEYLWVVDGVQESLVDNAAGGECSNDGLNTDYATYANRMWMQDTDMQFDTFDACSDTGMWPTTDVSDPTEDAATVLSVFGDTYGNLAGTNFDPDWGQRTDAVVGDHYVLNDLNYQGVSLDGGAVDVSDFEYLHIDYFIGNPYMLKLFLISPGPTEQPYRLDTSLTSQWVSVDIPLTEFSSVDLSSVFQLKFEGSGNLYIDNLYFGGGPAPDTTVSFTATLPDGTTSARLHSDALGWDVNHADGVGTDNGDGTWTATIPAPWAANANYKWLADGVEENLKDDVDAGYCANDGLNSGDWGANRVYSGSGDVTGQVFGECSDTPAPAPQVNVTFQVNMAGVDTTNGVSVMGGAIFGQAGLDMSDADGDNIWTVTTQIAHNTTVAFKYRNTTELTWNDQEAVSGDCTFGDWSDRQVDVAEADITLDVVAFGSCADLIVDTTVSFTATLPAGTTSARLHSEALGWDTNHADGVATDNGDGTWTATIPAPWAAGTNYKWYVDGAEENLKDDVDAGYCANDGLNSGDWGANRLYSGSGDVTGQVYGECSDTPAAADDTTGVVSNLVFDFEDNTVQYPSYGGVAASYATQDDAGVTRNMLKLVNGAGADWWSGVTIAVMPAGNDFLGDGTAPATMRVYAGQDGNLNLELEADGQGPAVVNLAVTQGWNDLSFDFSGADAAINWHKIQIRPDAAGQAANGAETTYYIDDLSFPNASILDSDSDGVNDLVDDLPNDATETVDSDGDGVGDNADELPYDPAFSTQAEYDAAQAMPAAPTPTDAVDSVLSIFSNAYTDLADTNFNPGWGQATQVAVDDVITYTGLNYQGTEFTSSDVSGYGHINIDFYTTNATDLQFTIISPGKENLISLTDKIVLNQWVSVEIPLTDFIADLTSIFQFKVVGNGTVVLDNLYFGGVGEVVEPPAQVNVTFQVNMAGVDTTNGVSVMGGAVFGQAGLDMSDADGDNIWTVTTQIAHNTTVAFKYRNTTALTWDGQESVTGDCTFGEWSDRQVDVAEADITLDVVAFGSCGNAIP